MTLQSAITIIRARIPAERSICVEKKIWHFGAGAPRPMEAPEYSISIEIPHRRFDITNGPSLEVLVAQALVKYAPVLPGEPSED